MSKKTIQVFEYEGEKITFDFGNGQEMVNATQMIKAFPSKKMNNFLRTNQTKDFIKEYTRYAKKRFGNDYEVLRVVKGGRKDLQGTWMDERLALKFAAWLSPAFEIWVYDRIKELLTKGTFNINENQIVIDKKTFQFLFDKHKDEQSNFNHFLNSLLNKGK